MFCGCHFGPDTSSLSFSGKGNCLVIKRLLSAVFSLAKRFLPDD
ncbi:hypothetical protein M099_2429 [Phocaeicola vulgatus str. 3975 RP4]|uniref:Uncharacterized protein n=1 Tax=Phocaeicola vulgatus str. 3975 RP4 TaxID=1339352 RepID=A0A069SIB0_PHOVU|nr:hypothetical protein M099_2429 [Phocaeicola vulgatus str. 3975 RP4]